MHIAGDKKEKKDKRGRKARAGANKRASASSRIPVPGAEFAEEPPVPRDSSVEPQHAKPAANVKIPAAAPVAKAPAPVEESDKVGRHLSAMHAHAAPSPEL